MSVIVDVNGEKYKIVEIREPRKYDTFLSNTLDVLHDPLVHNIRFGDRPILEKIVNDTLRISSVSFGDEHSTYDFFTDIGDLLPGDLVVVDTSRGIKVARHNHYLTHSTKATKWILNKVDMRKVTKKDPVQKYPACIGSYDCKDKSCTSCFISELCRYY